MTVKRTFTFGQGQELGGYGLLRDHYVEIEGETIDHCRVTMLNHFGRNWSMDYASPEEAGVERFNLKELDHKFWPVSTGKYFVDTQGVCRSR